MNKKPFVITIPILVVLLASLFASKRPDTLETIAISYSFESQAKEISSLFTGYSFPFIHNQFMSSFCAGTAGLFIIYIFYKVIKRFVK
ncbi:MAG: PDGLE domain-containing protein [Endomicrobium sp.]|nr:PDGLE domain-containing protein [Endomicrobium sp.]